MSRRSHPVRVSHAARLRGQVLVRGMHRDTRVAALEARARRPRVRNLGGIIDGAMNNVVRLANGHSLALCECGLESTADTEGDAWMWLLTHSCAGDVDT